MRRLLRDRASAFGPPIQAPQPPCELAQDVHETLLRGDEVDLAFPGDA